LGSTERQGRQFAHGKPPRFVCVVPGGQRALEHLGGVNDDEISAARMFTTRDHVDHVRDPYSKSGLFQAFPGSGFSWILARIDKAGRQGPEAAEGLIDAAHQQHAAILLNQDSRGDLRVGKMDPAALRADRTVFAETLFAVNGSPAPRAILYFVFLRHERSEAERRSHAKPPLNSATTKRPICHVNGMGTEAGAG